MGDCTCFVVNGVPTLINCDIHDVNSHRGRAGLVNGVRMARPGTFLSVCCCCCSFLHSNRSLRVVWSLLIWILYIGLSRQVVLQAFLGPSPLIITKFLNLGDWLSGK